MHYTSLGLHDGTVLSAWPIRKPPRRVFKRECSPIDPEGVVKEHTRTGEEISSVDNTERWRPQTVIAINLNVRRALRELVLPRLAETLGKVESLKGQLDRIEALLSSERNRVGQE
jgi:hypothetical protein